MMKETEEEITTKASFIEHNATDSQTAHALKVNGFPSLFMEEKP
jgi:hypothetical protein